MLSDNHFIQLVTAASFASSADNMQPWEFRKKGNTIEIFPAKNRVLPTDVMSMFTWVSIGAAMQNIVVKAGSIGLSTDIQYSSKPQTGSLAASIHFSQKSKKVYLAEYIPLRSTNRSAYSKTPLGTMVISRLSNEIKNIDANIHWMTDPEGLKTMRNLDAALSSIRLEHAPLHEELFSILRFNKKEIEATGFGLDFKSLEVPFVPAFFARLLRNKSVFKIIRGLKMTRLNAKLLSSKLPKSGALCLITAKKQNPVSYMEAGRAMEQLWLAATREGISLHPYGALPQFLTKAQHEPETFLPAHVEIINAHHDAFYSLFPKAYKEHPAIVLRIGWASRQSARSDFRLGCDRIIRKL